MSRRYPRVSIDCSAGGRTKQAMAKDCDINLIMAKYVKTGVIDHGRKYSGDYGYADSVDFHGAMNIVAKGDSMFADLPAVVRGRFNNDTALFLDFVQDEANAEEMVELGLASPSEPEVPEGALPPIVTPEPPAGDLPPKAAS